MADSTTADLSDDQIERLLREAEVRLATKQQSQDGKSLIKAASLEVAPITQSTTQQTLPGSAPAPSKPQHGEELSVRVPELRKSKKEMVSFCLSLTFTVALHMREPFHDESNIPYFIEVAMDPVMGDVATPE